MGLAHEAGAAIGRAIRHVHAGVDKLLSRKLARDLAPSIRLTSDELKSGDPLPVSATVDGHGVPPTLRWSDIPIEAKSLVLVVEDPDAPFPEPFVHWLVYGIAPAASALGSRTDLAGHEGRNSKLATGFTPAAPPPGHGLHRYHFQLFALDIPTELKPGVGRGALVDHMKGHVIAWGELVGSYERD